MRNPSTGVVKLIDFGASRRFVRVPNADVFNIEAVADLDAALREENPRLGGMLGGRFEVSDFSFR